MYLVVSLLIWQVPAEIIDRKVTQMQAISPSKMEVDVGKTLSGTEDISMCRRQTLCLYSLLILLPIS